MNITKELLKKESANFDVECIFQIDLANKGITYLGSLSECTNLEILNLSFNEISNLVPLKTLIHLQYLNLSCNRISNLDGLQSLEQVRSINLAGNLISSQRSLQPLDCLQNLTHLKLMDAKNGFTNPICNTITYKSDVRSILPNLSQLDDDASQGNPFAAYENTSKVSPELDQEFYNSIGNNPEWVSKEFFMVKAADDDIIENVAAIELEKFSNTCNKSKEFLNDTQKYLNTIKTQFHV